MGTLILLRHGQSVYNKEDLFTGWTDVALSAQGKKEAQLAGEVLLKRGLYPDVCFTSWLKRAIHTAQIVLSEMSWEQIDCLKSWKLNERHYGAWQRQNKAKVKAKVGEAHFLAVRRGYDTPPPPLDDDDPRAVRFEKKYQKTDPRLLPRSESLKDTAQRVLPYYHEVIRPQVQQGKTVLVCAHGNSLRALVMEIESLSPEEIVKVEIPTGEPVVYRLEKSEKLVKAPKVAF